MLASCPVAEANEKIEMFPHPSRFYLALWLTESFEKLGDSKLLNGISYLQYQSFLSITALLAVFQTESQHESCCFVALK